MKVICNTDKFNNLTKGESYQVIKTIDDYHTIKNNKGFITQYNVKHFFVEMVATPELSEIKIQKDGSYVNFIYNQYTFDLGRADSIISCGVCQINNIKDMAYWVEEIAPDIQHSMEDIFRYIFNQLRNAHWNAAIILLSTNIDIAEDDGYDDEECSYEDVEECEQIMIGILDSMFVSNEPVVNKNSDNHIKVWILPRD